MFNPEQFIIDTLRDFYDRKGYKYKTNYVTYQDWAVHHYNLALKMIRPNNYPLHISSVAQAKLSDPKLKADCDYIFNKFRTGQDVNAHQSSGLQDIDRDDALFNDWGIHHLHISSVKDNPSKYFYKRAKLFDVREN
jgi:hypothetical protein